MAAGGGRKKKYQGGVLRGPVVGHRPPDRVGSLSPSHSKNEEHSLFNRSLDLIRDRTFPAASTSRICFRSEERIAYRPVEFTTIIIIIIIIISFFIIFNNTTTTTTTNNNNDNNNDNNDNNNNSNDIHNSNITTGGSRIDGVFTEGKGHKFLK